MRVLNKRDVGHPPNSVYIGRPSIWGNPFAIGRDGNREQVIAKYRQWLWSQIQAGKITKPMLRQLHGKDLVCWCAPLPCHGDVLAKAVEWSMEDA